MLSHTRTTKSGSMRGNTTDYMCTVGTCTLHGVVGGLGITAGHYNLLDDLVGWLASMPALMHSYGHIIME